MRNSNLYVTHLVHLFSYFLVAIFSIGVLGHHVLQERQILQIVLLLVCCAHVYFISLAMKAIYCLLLRRKLKSKLKQELKAIMADKPSKTMKSIADSSKPMRDYESKL